MITAVITNVMRLYLFILSLEWWCDMDVIISNLTEILLTVIMAIIGFLGTVIKKKYDEWVTGQTKEKVVKTVCLAIKQLYGSLPGEEKLRIAKSYIKEMLDSKGITLNDLEM